VLVGGMRCKVGWWKGSTMLHVQQDTWHNTGRQHTNAALQGTLIVCMKARTAMPEMQSTVDQQQFSVTPHQYDSRLSRAPSSCRPAPRSTPPMVALKPSPNCSCSSE